MALRDRDPHEGDRSDHGYRNQDQDSARSRLSAELVPATFGCSRPDHHALCLPGPPTAHTSSEEASALGREREISIRFPFGG